MDVSSSLLSAVSGADALKSAVGLKLLGSVKDIQAGQVNVLLQAISDSNQAPHPYLGKSLDIRA
jgi:hypothetical protein